MTIWWWLTVYTVAWAAMLAPLHLLYTRKGKRRAGRQLAEHRRIQRHVFRRP